MSINEEKLKEWIEQVTNKLAHLEANQIAIINGDFCDTNTEPKEPLIKDEKIRKAVRAWWETIPDAVTDKRVLYKHNHDFVVGIYTIYCGAIYPETLEKCRLYTITELCGEDEE